MPEELIAWFENLGAGDVPRVGGKNASLGEMTQALGAAGIRVPAGFATTAAAYRAHVAESGIAPELAEQLAALQAGNITLQQAGQAIRHLFLERDLSPALAEAIRSAYRDLAAREKVSAPAVAVRSSATAEDLPTASFAG